MRVPIIEAKFPKLVYFFLIYQFISMLLTLGGLFTSRWVQQGTDDLKWRGSIRTYQRGVSNWQGKTYLEISEQICQVQGTFAATQCSLFKDLHYASLVYIPCESLFLMCTLLWFVLTLRQCCKFRSKNRCLIATPIVFGWLVHTVGLIVWGKLANGSFSGDCDKLVDSNGERNIVCNKDGPDIGVTLVVITFVVGGIYIGMNWKNRIAVSNKFEETENDGN